MAFFMKNKIVLYYCDVCIDFFWFYCKDWFEYRVRDDSFSKHLKSNFIYITSSLWNRHAWVYNYYVYIFSKWPASDPYNVPLFFYMSGLILPFKGLKNVPITYFHTKEWNYSENMWMWICAVFFFIFVELFPQQFYTQICLFHKFL